MKSHKGNFPNFKKWLSLPEKEKKRVIRSLDVYSGQGTHLVHQIYKKFKKEYSNLSDVIDVDCGIYHGGNYIIGVTLYATSRLKLPSHYEGVTIQLFYTYITKAVRKKLGKACDEIGDFIDLNYKTLLSELKKSKLSFESASKDDLISIINKLNRMPQRDE